MFTIIGGDGKEYGPVSTDQVRVWINSGRANLDTKARSVGSEEWRRLGEFPEFSSPEGPPPVIPTTPPPLGASGSTPDTGPQLAGLGQRFGGALIDGVLAGLCWLPGASAFGEVFREQIRSGMTPDQAVIMEALTHALSRAIPFLLALTVLQAVLLSLRGQSIGKLLLGTRIVRYATNAKAGFLHAFFLRGVVTLVIELIPLLGSLFRLVDVCFIFGEQRRCVHDFIAGTKVVKA